MTDATKSHLKAIFRGYRRMTPGLKSELEKMGFIVENGGKHIRIRYGPKKTALSMTPSDYRTGLNTAMQLSRMLREPEHPQPAKNTKNIKSYEPDGMEY